MSQQPSTKLEVAEVTAADTPSLIALMERERCPCFCRFWHFTGTNKEWEARCALAPEQNRTELQGAIEARSNEGKGLIARLAGDGSIVGWMKLTPRAAMPKLLARVPYRDLGEREGVLSIGCFVVDPAHRRRGVARALVEGALAIAPRWGAAFVEAYPRGSDLPLHDGEAFMGPIALYRSLGFEIARDAPQYPVLRKRV